MYFNTNLNPFFFTGGWFINHKLYKIPKIKDDKKNDDNKVHCSCFCVCSCLSKISDEKSRTSQFNSLMILDISQRTANTHLKMMTSLKSLSYFVYFYFDKKVILLLTSTTKISNGALLPWNSYKILWENHKLIWPYISHYFALFWKQSSLNGIL